jgi:hypothetical protein
MSSFVNRGLSQWPETERPACENREDSTKLLAGLRIQPATDWSPRFDPTRLMMKERATEARLRGPICALVPLT